MTVFSRKHASPTDQTQRTRAPGAALMGTGGPPRPQVKPDRIRARAFEIYEARRGAPGDALSDWLQAERELNGAPDAAPVASARESARTSDASPESNPLTGGEVLLHATE